MVRFLSLVVLAVAAMAAAVAMPSVATPAAAVRPATDPPVATDGIVSFVTSMRGVQAACQKMNLTLEALTLRAIRPVWAAFKAGKFDAKIDAFKAGKLDAYIPTPVEVFGWVDDVAGAMRETIFPLFAVMDALKAGELDAWLASAKKGTLKKFLMELGDKLANASA